MCDCILKWSFLHRVLATWMVKGMLRAACIVRVRAFTVDRNILDFQIE